MLELKPNCERCDAVLPPEAEARICSYECTFCVPCAEGVLGGVCPNCGGTLVPRPIRASVPLPPAAGAPPVDDFAATAKSTGATAIRRRNEARHQLRRWLWGYALIVRLLGAAVWDMTTKPGL